MFPPARAPGRRGVDRQRLRHPRPVRPVPLHRREPLGVLPGLPPHGGSSGVRSDRSDRSSPTSSSITCRRESSAWWSRRSSRRRWDPGRFLELFGVDDGERPLSTRLRPGGPAAPDSGIADDGRRSGGSCWRPWRWARLLEDNVVTNALAIAGWSRGRARAVPAWDPDTSGPARRPRSPGCSRASRPFRSPSSGPRWPGRGSPWSARPRSSPSAWRRAMSSRLLREARGRPRSRSRLVRPTGLGPSRRPPGPRSAAPWIGTTSGGPRPRPQRGRPLHVADPDRGGAVLGPLHGLEERRVPMLLK